MSAKGDAALSIACAENIALLQFLHTVPAQPSFIDVHQSAATDSDVSRLLPLEQERRLTSILAVLSSVREDVNRITAVAVQEASASSSLNVLVAVNRTSSSDGRANLKEVKAGFNRIFALLAKATENNLVLEPKLLAEVVSTCKNRILSRLRLKKHKRNKDLKPLDDRINEIVKAVTSFHGQNAWSFTRPSRRLALEIQAYTKHKSTPKLCRLVEEAEIWTRATKNASCMLGSIPSRVLDPTAYTAFRDTIRKIAQYKRASRRLFAMACTFPILRKVAVKAVTLADSVFARPKTDGYEPSLLRTLRRIEMLRGQKTPLATLCRYLGEKRTPETAQTQFKDAVERALTESKVHAEVQILAYLSTIPPSERARVRVVQSNKKGCFLCTRLFAVNEGPVMPKGHGRIYEGWRLPSLPQLKGLRANLNAALEDQARTSIAMLLQKKRKIGYADPYESSALSTSVSTIVDAAAAASKVELKPLDITETPKSADSSDGTSPLAQEDVRGLEQAPVDPLHPAGDHSLPAGQTSLTHVYQDSELCIQYSVGSNHKNLGQSLRYSVRKLDDDEKVPVAAYNVSNLAQGSEIIMEKAPSYCLDLNGVVVELVLYR